MKTISIEIPEGKEAEWVNGVLTLVDEQPKDITERIKTFEDACKWCKENGKEDLVWQWSSFDTLLDVDESYGRPADILAYLKLRIITCALNEGWEPTFEEDEYRWYAWYELLTREELDEMSDEEKADRHVIERPNSFGSHCGLGYSSSHVAWASSVSYLSARLAFKSSELAEYAAKQFVEVYADFCYKGKE